MRLLINPNVLAPIGGVEMSMLQVNGELARRGNEITALYQRGGSQEARWREITDGRLIQVPTFDFTKTTALRDLRDLRPAVRAVQQAKPDVVHLNRAEQTVWGLLAARRAGVPLVTHLRTEPDFPGVNIVGRMTTHFIAVSDYIRRQWVGAGVPADRISVIHNGITEDAYPTGGAAELRRARAELGISPDAFVVLYCGRVAPEKGVDVLMESWRRLGYSPDEATLLLVGADEVGPDAEHVRRLKASQPPGCVWMGLQDDVTTVMHAADVVVLPALWQEPFGRVVIEGLATGRPVVASRVGGIPEILTGEFSSMLVDPGDPLDLASALGKLKDWRRNDPWLGSRCAQHVVNHFALGQKVAAIEDVLSRAIDSRRASRKLGRVA
jgi:glycosyltransferase involved in cell wall biosynthesis